MTTSELLKKLRGQPQEAFTLRLGTDITHGHFLPLSPNVTTATAWLPGNYKTIHEKNWNNAEKEPPGPLGFAKYWCVVWLGEHGDPALGEVCP